MSGNKTIENQQSVDDFIASVENEQRQKDANIALEMITRITNLEPKMWGNSIVGFGSYHYKYPSGREGDYFRVGFSPRKASTTFYIMAVFPEYGTLLGNLGKHKIGKSCLYISKLENIDLDVLEKILKSSFEKMNMHYPIVEST